MSWLTTHVLNTATGTPAAGVTVRLEVLRESGYVELTRATTDADGRVRGLLASEAPQPGQYRLTFSTGQYFAAHGTESFYPQVTVEFTVNAGATHYHVPLLISPFGYTTYRGS